MLRSAMVELGPPGLIEDVEGMIETEMKKGAMSSVVMVKGQ